MTVALPPTVEQLLNLADRAEHKGGLNPAEAARLRDGLRLLRGLRPADIEAELVDMQRRYENQRRLKWRWKKRATTAGYAPTTDEADEADELTEPVPDTVDTTAEDAIARVTALAQRWTHIPAKRAAAIAVLNALTNRNPE